MQAIWAKRNDSGKQAKEENRESSDVLEGEVERLNE
jgi:hypothetical protein